MSEEQPLRHVKLEFGDQVEKAKKMPIAVAVEMRVVVGAKLGEVEQLADALEEVIRRFVGMCTARGMVALPSHGAVGQVRHEELVALMPRKTHYEMSRGHWACDTKHVSPKKLVKDWGDVTCKLCLEHRPSEGEEVLGAR